MLLEAVGVPLSYSQYLMGFNVYLLSSVKYMFIIRLFWCSSCAISPLKSSRNALMALNGSSVSCVSLRTTSA